MKSLLPTGLGIVWFFAVAIGGAHLMEYLTMTYPDVAGPLLPVMLIVVLLVILGGRVLLRKILNH